MGRQSQSRQARRAQERRQREKEGIKEAQSTGARGRPPTSRGTARGRASSGPSWSLVAGGGVVAIAIVIFVLAVSGVFKGGGASANGPGTLTAPPGPVIAGIHCDQGMTSTSSTHVHARVSIYIKGVEQTISPDYGHDYNDDCLFWMHAHQDVNGIIHMESPYPIHPTLATWHLIAEKTLPQSNAKVPPIVPPAGLREKAWVNLKPYNGDPTQIKLYRHTQVVLEFGPPFVPPKPFTFPPGL